MYLQIQVIEVIRHPTERAESGRGSGSGSAPADEERYRELVKENEELQKLIAQVPNINFSINNIIYFIQNL